MLDPSLTDDDVRDVIAAMAATEPDDGAGAEFVWESLTAGEGPSMISLASLQEWLWWLFPKRSWGADSAEEWFEVAEIAAKLFDQLAAPDYAAASRSETTQAVFAAWAQSSGHGAKAAVKAIESSPVHAPDLDDFAWGGVFGITESSARDQVQRALERALADGRLDPTKRNWKRTAQEICQLTLDQTHPSDVGQSWRSLVLSERAETWSNATPEPKERSKRASIARAYMSPPPLPDISLIKPSMAPLIWLAEQCADGVTLTGSLYLPPDLVRAGVDRFPDWWPSWETKPPRSEADVFGLGDVRDAASQLGWVRRRGKTLKTTKAGLAMIEDPVDEWPSLAMLGNRKSDFVDAVTEQLALRLIDGEVHEFDALRSEVIDALEERGWAIRQEGYHSRDVYLLTNPWQLWNFIDVQEEQWLRDGDGQRIVVAKRSVQATPAGLAAGALWLHHRITGPRSHP